MSARRCSIGCQNWPDEPLFTHCAVCGDRTRRIRNADPDIERDEAALMILYREFDRYYERWCHDRGQPVEGPLPYEDASEQGLLTPG